MPLYEYLCEKCGRKMEAIQSFSEPPLTVCDRCGGQLKKLMSAPAVQFKGSGWYVSDYGKGSSGPSPSSTKSEDAAKSETKPETTKPEAKPEPTKKPDAA
jgi:putative FmdB family regulatory protein